MCKHKSIGAGPITNLCEFVAKERKQRKARKAYKASCKRQDHTAEKPKIWGNFKVINGPIR